MTGRLTRLKLRLKILPLPHRAAQLPFAQTRQMQDGETALRSRLAGDERILATMKADLATMLAQQVGHKAALLALEQVIAQLDGDISDLTTRCDSLEQSISRRRAALTPRPPDFPLEILGEIFKCARDSHELTWPDIPVKFRTAGRTMEPFKCAAVSKQWRRAALATPALWTYIGVVGSLSRRGSAMPWLERVQLLLLRSRACLLEIDIDVDMGNYDVRRHYDPILSELLAHCDRWQRFSLSGWSNFAKKNSHSILALLNGRTPFLEAISMEFLECQNMKWPSSPGFYLPYAPKLRYAAFEHIPVAFDRSDSDPLSATELKLCESSYNISRFCATLASFPHLTTLRLCPRDTDRAAGPRPDVLLHDLQSLHIYRGSNDAWGDFFPEFASVLDRIVAPELRALEVFPEAIQATTALVQRCSSTVKSLHVDAGFLDSEDMAEPLARLHELRTLSFNNCHFMEEFQDALCRAPDAPIWPKLERIVLQDSQEMDEPAFVRFLRERYPLSSGQAWACPLLEVDMSRDSLLDSLTAGEIRHILETERQRLAAETEVASQT